MSLKLMYITNNPAIAQIAQQAGVDRIFIDMEYIGKEIRQAGMNTVKSHHTIEDIKSVRTVLTSSELMVRINPIHDEKVGGIGSKQEIDAVIKAGADYIMLPMFHTPDEVKTFIKLVDGRTKTILLLETDEAMNNLDQILEIDGIDEIHIGLNDLHIAQKKKFMFELLSDGTVEKITEKIKSVSIPYGFGGIARLGYGMLPSEYIIGEHYRLGSSMAILSRSFCNTSETDNIDEISSLFKTEVVRIRNYEALLSEKYTKKDFDDNKKKLCQIVDEILLKM